MARGWPQHHSLKGRPMSGSISSVTSAANAAAAAMSTTAAASSASGTTTAAVGNIALQQLGSNFNDFLSLLTTQLQNQDPTSPMDTNQFTSELVQFTGVQQQVATNSSLTQLIALQQTSQVLQSSDLVGKPITVSSNELSLQNSTAAVTFQGNAGEQIGIAVVNSAGAPIVDVTATAAAGTNTWQWNGLDNNGNQVPDGTYRVAVETLASNGGTPVAVPYDVIGTATGVSSNGTTSQLAIGALSVPFSAIVSVGDN
jgi:flagellar basal-body rod modification protein FlgD